jgi:hypothetical protein
MIYLHKPKPFLALSGFKKDRIDIFYWLMENNEAAPVAPAFYCIRNESYTVTNWQVVFDFREPDICLMRIDEIMNNEKFSGWWI